MRRVPLLLVALGAACARSRVGEPAAATPAAAVEPCTAPVPDDHGPWRLVRGDGFTFCVPTSWSPSSPPAGGGADRRTYRFSGGTLLWSGTEVRRIVTIRAPAAGMMPPQPNVQRLTETIGGQLAELYISEPSDASQLYTGARWTGAHLYFSGEARNRVAAALQLEVYRTVRFIKE